MVYLEDTCSEFAHIVLNVYDIRIVAAAIINFSLAWVWLLIEGGSCSRAAFFLFQTDT